VMNRNIIPLAKESCGGGTGKTALFFFLFLKSGEIGAKKRRENRQTSHRELILEKGKRLIPVE